MVTGKSQEPFTLQQMFIKQLSKGEDALNEANLKACTPT
jgi:hypothetical protein